MFKYIDKIYSAVDIKNLLKKMEHEEFSYIKAEAMAFLLEYMSNNDLIGKINHIDNEWENTGNSLIK